MVHIAVFIYKRAILGFVRLTTRPDDNNINKSIFLKTVLKYMLDHGR